MECCVKWSCVYTYIYYTDCCMSITHIWVRIPNTVFQTKRLLLSLFFFSFYSIKITTIIIIVVVTIKT